MNAPRRKAVILTADRFEDLEVFFPLFRLREMGWEVDIATPAQQTIHGEHGYRLEPTMTIKSVNPDVYNLLIIPGGSPTGAPAAVRDSEPAREIVRSFFKKNKPVGSICHGPWTLAAAGVLKGRHLTSFWHDGVPEDVKESGGVWEDKEVVVDGNLVTSRHPPDLPAFMREIERMVGELK